MSQPLLYRRIAVLAISAALTFSAGLAAAAYAVPAVSYVGPTATFAGALMEGAITLPSGGDAIYQWTIVDFATKAVVASGDSAAVSFTPSKPGRYQLFGTAYSHTLTDAPPPLIGKITKVFTVAAPVAPRVSVEGPKRVASGEAGLYFANVMAPLPAGTSNLVEQGRWTLPDGTVIPTSYVLPGTRPSLYYTPPVPTTTDVGAEQVIKYEAWYAGFESKIASGTFATSSWAYRMPTWTITAAPTKVGAALSATAVPSDPSIVPYLKGLTFNWATSDKVLVASSNGPKLIARPLTATTETISLTVNDAYGNTREASLPVTVAPGLPFQVSVLARSVSKWKHSPIDVAVVARASGGAGPIDPATSYQYSVNGTVVAENTTGRALIKLDTVGRNVISVLATSRSQLYEAVNTAAVDVAEADTPVCSLQVGTPQPTTNGTAWPLVATATSTTGLITKYEWIKDSVPLGAAPNKLTILTKAGIQPTTVTVRATTSAGLTCEASQTISPL